MALSRQDIARAGLRLLNDVGLNGLTLRLIADELGVKAPALYWHFKNKEQLLDEMATQMYRDAQPGLADPGEGQDWESYLKGQAFAMRRMLLRYRDGAKVFSGTFFTDEKPPNETALLLLIKSGVEPRRAGRALFTLYTFVIGFTIEEQAVYPVPGDRDKRYDEVLERHRAQADQDYYAAISGMFTDDIDHQFAESLDIVLTGLRAYLGDPR
ncbi:TetR/AcrR family transcriptional regulator C-terminal domain-containing protein [Amycolatopsis anabasis]|uniref:TetR/AcrR family transcriptional regulator C-terminal domain-containing protein n=1 Tax=Amycolatopsis anabasis TaxID=1840409 RepID=UPI00131EA741|nr:TetR/AcrR family transcriptional regulator C-terminal domain-containing protein [Amycolatopsis anabasis]